MKPILYFMLTCAMWGQTCNSWDRKNFDGVPTKMAVKAKDIALCKQWLDSTCQDDQAVILVCPAGFKVMYDWQLHHAATTDGQVIWQTVGYPWPECMDEAKAKERLRDFYVSAAPKPAESGVDTYDILRSGASQPVDYRCWENGIRTPCPQEQDNFHGSKTLVTTVAPKPSFTIEKAVKVKSAPPDVECWYSSGGRPIPDKTMCNNLIPVTQYSCPKRPGYATFLLPDESTGEKMCLIFPADSGRTKEK